MPELNEDLWPSDLGIVSIVTPAAILRAQATLLGEKTKGSWRPLLKPRRLSIKSAIDL
jgi:hypothetical protein